MEQNLEQLEKELSKCQSVLKQHEATLKPLKDNIKSLKLRISEIKENEKYNCFDDIMRKYYTHKLPKGCGDDLTELHNYWDNRTDEDKMRNLFGYAEMERYRTYDVASMLWEDGCAEQFLTDNGVSESTIEGLEAWYDSDKTHIKKFSDIPEKEQEGVREYMRLFYNIIISKCVCDW